MASFIELCPPCLTQQSLGRGESPLNCLYPQPHIHHSASHPSYVSLVHSQVSDWWEEFVYLRSRNSLMVNSNYYMMVRREEGG